MFQQTKILFSAEQFNMQKSPIMTEREKGVSTPVHINQS